MLSGRLPSITSPKTAVVTAVACLLLLGLASHLYSGGVASRSLANTHDLHASPVEAPVQASPDPLKPRRDEFGGVVVHWLLPTLPKLTDERTIRHVLLLFHGCTHQGLDWFTFPEERIVVQAALRLGFGVAAFTSADRWSGCWDNSFPPKENIEAVAVRGAFNALTNAMATEAVSQGFTWDAAAVKYIGLGGSSGGVFVTLLPSLLPLHGIAVYIAPGHPKALSPSPDDGSLCASPTRNVVFVYMPRDTMWASVGAIADAKAALTGAGCNRGKLVTAIEIRPRPVAAALLMDRIPEFRGRENVVTALLQELSAAACLDAGTSLLTDAFPAADVEAILTNAWHAAGLQPPQDFAVHVAHVSEILRMCYAQHEYASENIHAVFSALIAA